MDKILKLRELIRPIFTLVEQSKSEIDEMACDIEADNEIPDEEWDVVLLYGCGLSSGAMFFT